MTSGFTVAIDDLAASASTLSRLHTDVLDALAVAGRALAPSAGMAGDDPVLAPWRDLHDRVAGAVWTVHAAAAGTLLDIAARLTTTGNNYLDADHASGAPGVDLLPIPGPPGPAPPGPPSSTGPVGPGVPAELAAYWPGGDPARLRGAADAWRRLADDSVEVASGADAAFRALTRDNTGDTFSAIAHYWSQLFQTCGTDPLFNAGPTTARILARSCAELADAIDISRREIGRAAAEAAEALSDLDLPAQFLGRFTRGITVVELQVGKVALTTKFLNEYRDRYLDDLDRIVAELARVDVAHLDSLAAPPPPRPAVDVALTDVGDVVGLGLSGSAWDAVGVPHPGPDSVRLSAERADHILDGDGPGKGGGHGAGTGKPGKSEFPPHWTDDDVLRAVIGVARDPERSVILQPNQRWRAEGVIDEVRLQVIVEPDGRIVTAYPISGPGVVRNPPA